MGALFHNSTLLSLGSAVLQWPWMQVLGFLELLLLGLIAFYRKLYFRLQSIIYILVFVTVFIMIGLLASSSNASFQSAFNAYSAPYTNSTNYYQDVMSIAAQKNGWSPPDTSSVYNTILLVPVLTIFYGTFIASTYVGGEIKHPSRSSLLGMLVAMWLTCILTIVFIGVAYNTVGFKFLSALDSLLYSGNLAIPVLPYMNFLALLLTNNSFIIFFVFLIGVVQSAVYIPAFYYLGSRSFLAYSFDRVLPSIFARVSEKYHVPTVSIILLIVLSEVAFIVLQIPYTAAAIYEFETVLTWYACIFPLLFVGIAGVVFPYVKKSMFESSPLKTKVGGIPLMSLTGLGTIITSLLIIYLMLTNPVYAANSIGPILAIVAFTIVFFAIYFVAKVYRQRQGMPLDLAFKQVPPE
jgi:amino acid transporter